MNNKRKKLVSAICIFLAVLMALSLILTVLPGNAVSEAEIEELQRKREALSEELTAQEELLNELESDHALIIERKAALDRRAELNRQDIELLNGEILALEEKIREASDAVDESDRSVTIHRERYLARVRSAEEAGSYSYLNYVIGAQDLSDLLARLYDVSEIIRFDKELGTALRSARARQDAVRSEYDTLLLERQQLQGELETRREQLDLQTEAAAELIRDLMSRKDAAQEEFDAIEQAVSEALEAELQALAEYARQNEAARQAAMSMITYVDSGSSDGNAPAAFIQIGDFIWPVDSTYITSLFGERDAPTQGASTYHQAIDIGAAAGSPVYAAADGVVIVAAYNSGLGNYVTISHSNNTTTRYSHLTSFTVSPGQTVSQGQIIGYVGQTGIATGDHLDFAVIENGQAVDPLQYYDTSGLTFDPTA